MKYVHDPILNNKTKEKMYKIHTRAIPVARKSNNQSKQGCAFCGILEDELHCFVKCNRVLILWEWIKRALLHACPWLSSFTDIDLLFGYPLQTSCPKNSLQIWRVFHAETIRIIWYSRCRKVFDDEEMSIEEMKARISYRVQSTFSIHEASSCKKKKLHEWKHAFPKGIHNKGRFRLNIDTT
jgi:hypothetical protein